MLLHVIGDEGLELCNAFKYDDEGDCHKFDDLMKREKKLLYVKERHDVAETPVFHQITTNIETIDQFTTELKRSSKFCDFGELKEDLIKDRIVCSINTKSNVLREKLLRTQDFTLDKASQVFIAHAASKAQMKELTEGQETVAVSGKQRFQQRQEKERTTQSRCNRCGLSSNHDLCPAIGNLCHKFNKSNSQIISQLCVTLDHVLKEVMGVERKKFRYMKCSHPKQK